MLDCGISTSVIYKVIDIQFEFITKIARHNIFHIRISKEHTKVMTLVFSLLLILWENPMRP